MSTHEIETLSDAELKSVPTEEFVSALRDMPRDAIERLNQRTTLTEVQSGALSAFLSMAPLIQTDSRTAAEGNAQAADDKYIPLRNRLTSWWNGTSNSESHEVSPGTEYGLESDIPETESSEIAAGNWSATSIDIAETVWSEGFIEPGGAALARKIIAPANPESTKTVLDLSAGLGGSAFTYARDSNLWMEGYESDPVLARKAQEIARVYMMTKRVPIKLVDYATVDLKLKHYDLIYSRDRLFTTPHKRRLIQQVAGALKPGGQFLLTDYVRRAESGFTEPFNNWLDSERSVIYPWTDTQYVDELRRAGLKMKTSHDFSEKIKKQIHSGWLRMMRSLDSTHVDRNYVDQLVKEGEIWLARVKALESGDVQVIRIIAIAN